jgi:hypothetical protein
MLAAGYRNRLTSRLTTRLSNLALAIEALEALAIPREARNNSKDR